MVLLFSLGQQLPQNARRDPVCSLHLCGKHREVPFPHQGEAGFGSRGDSLDKAEITQSLLDRAALIMPSFRDLCIFSFSTTRHPAG